MRVVFLEDVQGVALGGEIKEVKRGFARNYLIPQKLAIPATKDALQRIDRLAQKSEDIRLSKLSDMKELAIAIDGQQIAVAMRAGASGGLYGSVTSSIIADQLSEIIKREIDRQTVLMPEAIRKTGKHSVKIRLHSDVIATISLIVYPMDSTLDEFLTELESEATTEIDRPSKDVGSEQEDLNTNNSNENQLPQSGDESEEQTDSQPDEQNKDSS